MELYNKEHIIETEAEIISYFMDCGYDLFEQNTTDYYEEESTTIKVGDKYFDVTVYVTMFGAKQDVGDKLYTIDSIDRIEYQEIEYDDLVARVNKQTENEIKYHENRIKQLKKELVF